MFFPANKGFSRVSDSGFGPLASSRRKKRSWYRGCSLLLRDSCKWTDFVWTLFVYVHRCSWRVGVLVHATTNNSKELVVVAKSLPYRTLARLSLHTTLV